MTGVAVFARLGLAAVFALAGSMKLADRDAAEDAAVELGAPPAAARGVVVALSIVELTLAVLLLVGATARAAALGIAVLSLALTIVVAVALARGRRPECRCFGELSSAPIGPLTLVRNLALAAVAGALVAFGTQKDPVSWVADMTAIDRLTLAVAALACAVAALAFALVRAHGRILLRVDALEARTQPRLSGLPVGSPAPPLDVVDSSGAPVDLSDVLNAGGQTLIVFSDTRCGPCQALLPDIARWQQDPAASTRVVLVSGGSAEDVRALADEHGLRQVLLDVDGQTTTRYRVAGTPTGVLLDEGGSVAAPPATGAPAIASLATPIVVRLG